MTRRRKVVLALLLLALSASAALVLALPEIVRRTLVAKLPAITGRAASIASVELNPFTGRFAMNRFRLAERKGSDAFVEFERLETRIWLPALLGADIRFLDIRLASPTVRVLRTGPVEFNFTDLLELLGKPDPNRKPSRWTITIDRAVLAGGRIVAEDRAVSPATDWSIGDLQLEMAGVSTAPGRPPGKLTLRARIGTSQLEVIQDSIRLAPGVLVGRIKLTGFDLARLKVYWPSGAPALLEAGTAELALAITLSREQGKEDVAQASGDVTLTNMALSQPDGTAPFATVPRLAVQIKQADLIARQVTLAALELDGLDVKAVRRPDGTIDLIPTPAAAAPDAASPPTSAAPPVAPEAKAWQLRIERLSVKNAQALLTDQTLTPARPWRIRGLTVDGAGLSLVRGEAPGSLQVKAEVLTPPGTGAPVSLAIELDAARAEPLVASGRVTLSRLDLTSLLPYVKAELPAALTRGVLAVDIAMAMEESETEMVRATVSGAVHVTDLAVTQKDAPAPFFTAPRMSVRVKQADALANTVTVTAAELEGARLRFVRDAQGNVDLLALRSSLPPPPPPAPPAPPGTVVIPRRLIATAVMKALAAPWTLALDRLAVTKGGVTFEDRALSPPVVLPVDDIEVIGQRLTWPAKGPAVVTLRAAMPGGGHTEVKVTGIPDPLDIQLTSVTRDAPIAPYARYFPFAARFEGHFNGDSLNEVKQDGDVLRAASRGTAWATDIQVVDPQSPTPLVRLERLEIRDIDFSWPNYALVPKITLTKPEIRVERDPDGVFNLRRAFEPRDKPAAAGPAAPPSPTPAPTATTAEPDADTPKKPTLIETIVLDFSEIVLEEGFIRFLDRTTTPAFSQDMSHLRVEIRDLSNVLGRKRTTMTAKATVGGDAALDLRGELSGIGETLRADLVGEIRDFQLASANPYAGSLTSWIVERGKLQAKVHYRVEGDRITAEHDVNFGGLKVAKTEGDDEAKKRLGLPLGLIVGLLKDSRGNIDFNLPLQGSLSDRSFDWGETMWAGVKQTLLKVLAAPFRAIGRLFTGGGEDKDKIEEVRIEPLRFPPGSSVIGPAAEQQLTHVADFLRRSPFVGLSLAPVATAPDVENLRLQALTARITKLQEDKKLPDFPAAVAAYYAEQKIEGPPPKTTEERMAILIKREPAPDAGAVAALLERRVTTTREAFTRLEGIPAERLVPGPPRQLPAEAAEGRVEFSLVAE